MFVFLDVNIKHVCAKTSNQRTIVVAQKDKARNVSKIEYSQLRKANTKS